MFLNSFASCIDQLKSGRPSSAVVSTEALPSLTLSTESVSSESVAGPPSGLSESALKRFACDSPPAADDLEKVSTVKFHSKRKLKKVVVIY